MCVAAGDTNGAATPEASLALTWTQLVHPPSLSMYPRGANTHVHTGTAEQCSQRCSQKVETAQVPTSERVDKQIISTCNGIVSFLKINLGSNF